GAPLRRKSRNLPQDRLAALGAVGAGAPVDGTGDWVLALEAPWSGEVLRQGQGAEHSQPTEQQEEQKAAEYDDDRNRVECKRREQVEEHRPQPLLKQWLVGFGHDHWWPERFQHRAAD